MRDTTAPKNLLAKVGADGRFALRDVPAGRYLVHTFAPAYVSPDDTVYPTSETAHVATGPLARPDALMVEVTVGHESACEVRLQRGGTLEGTVRLGDGTPAVGLPVNAERRLGPHRYARVGGAGHADGTGRYVVDGLAPGDYIVFVATGGVMVPAARGGSRGSSGLPVYAPSTIRPDEATVVHIGGTETHTLDVSLFPATALHRLEGDVAVNDDKAMQLALVRLYSKDEGGLTASTPLTASGSFSFAGVPDGVYTVSVEFQPASEFVGIEPDGQSVRMRLRKPLYATTTVQVTVKGQDVAGVLIEPAEANR